jgi:hypothetical protein
MIRTSVYNIGKGTTGGAAFPNDNTVPQITEGTQFFSQAYTPSTASCDILIRAFVNLAEATNVADDIGFGLFTNDSNDCLTACSGIWGVYATPYGHDQGTKFIEYKIASWGTSSRTFSLRMHKCNGYNYAHLYGNSHGENKFGSSATSTCIIQEYST